MGRHASTSILVVLLLALLAATAPAWSQSPPPRGTEAATEFEFPRFSSDLLKSEEKLGEHPAHYVFLVDVTASVGSDLLDSWRRGVFNQMCGQFMADGDRVSIVPFGLHPNWADARLEKKYQRTDSANLVSSFPQQCSSPDAKGTAIYGSIGEVLEQAEKKGWVKENLVIVVITDDQLQGQSSEANQKFQRLRDRHLEGNPSTTHAYVYPRAKHPKTYSIYTFTNAFPDETRLKSRRPIAVAVAQGAPPGAGAAPGASGAPGPTGATGATGSTGTAEGPSEKPKTPRPRSGFPWKWIIPLVLIALLAWWLFQPTGFRYRVDGNPGKIRSGDRPVPVSLTPPGGSPEAVADLRVVGRNLVVTARKGFTATAQGAPAGASASAARASSSSPKASSSASRRSAAAPAPPPLPLPPGAGAAYRMHEVSFVRTPVASSGWSQEASGPQAMGTVRIEVARLESAPTRPTPATKKKGAQP